MARLKLSTTETDIKKLVSDWFKGHGGWSFAPVSRGMGVHGIPDRIGCIPITITQDMVGITIGAFVGIEAKAPGRRTEEFTGCSPLQVGQLEGIAQAHGLGYVVDGQSDIYYLDTVLGQPIFWLLNLQRLIRRINKNG